MISAFVAMVGWVALEGGGVVPSDAGRDAPAQAGGLAGLESALSGTGRIGNMHVQGAVVEGATVASHRDPVVRPASGGGAATDPTASQVDPIGIPQMEKVEHQVESCRLEVARRRGVTPASVAAEAVTVRWTIESNGHVRDAEAVEAKNTDLEVAACAKRVIADWVFSKPASGQATVQRSFKL